MAIPGSAHPMMMASLAEPEAYAIERSVRFNSSDSAYLSRTPASAGNRKTWTWAGWVKRSKLAVQQSIFGANVTGGQGFRFRFESSDTLRVLSGDNGTDLIAVTSSVFRDPSAWFHIILQIDTTQVTGSNRAKIYVNGVQQTISFTNTPSQNQDLSVNSAIEHQISNADGFGYVDLYLADVHFIDGQALDPTSFGEFDTNGIWQPIEYSGSYGTNGFHLDFADNSTAAALGTDTSGNGNDWTVNNISVSGTFDISSSEAPRSGTEPEKMFDGSTGTFWQVTSASTLTFNPPIPVTGTIKIYASRGGNNPVASDFQINGHGITTFPTSVFSAQEFTLNSTDTSAIGSSISTIHQRFENTVTATRPYYLKINDQIVYAISPSANDSLVDVPTNGTETDTGVGSEVRGNYCTWNPLDLVSTTLANGNLQATGSSNTGGVNGTIGVFSGKWYWEVTAGSTHDCIGIWSTSSRASTFTGGTADSYGYFGNLGTKVNSGSGVSYGATFGSGDIIGIALDLDAGTLTFYKNNASQGTAFTGLTGGFRPSLRAGAAGFANTVGAFLNAGQRPFAYTAPSGFKALNTASLPAPVVTKPSEYMDVALYTGNGGTNTISGLGFSPDWVWVKRRSTTASHRLWDTVRGVNKYIGSNLTNAEVDDATSLTSFNSDGFTLGSHVTSNASGETYVAWTWDAGSSTVTNTDGSITSSVRANASAGFSIVSYTGNATAGATIGHGLNVTPSMIIIKNRSSTAEWIIYHSSKTTTGDLRFDTTTGTTADKVTATSSTTFTVADDGAVNGNSTNHVAYCFAPVDGYSSFGSYTGNGSADGPFVFTGMRPRWILLKRSDGGSENWTVWDTARNTFNVMGKQLYPNSSAAEADAGTNPSFGILDSVSNGFKLRGSHSSFNSSGGTFIYAAFAEHPFASNARAR